MLIQRLDQARKSFDAVSQCPVTAESHDQARVGFTPSLARLVIILR